MRTEAYKMRISLLVLVLTPFCLLLLIAFVNNGLQLEMNNSIDINHHVWFSNFIIRYGRIPQDGAYEYMPLSLLTVPILTLINGVYSPIYILLRAFLPQLLLILLMWVYLSGKPYKYDRVIFIRFLCLLTVAYPISYAFYPFYLSINGAIVPIIVLVPLVERILSVNKDRLSSIILYTLLFLVALLSNFSYTLIFMILFFASKYLASIIKSRSKIRDINKLLLISGVMALTYITYVILAEARSFREPLIRLMRAVGKLLSGEVIVSPLKKSLVELDPVSLLVSAMKLYGVLVAPYGLLLLFTLIRILRERVLNQYDFAVLLSFLAIVVLLPIAGYDTFRIMNVVNLLLPIVTYKLMRSFTSTGRQKDFVVAVLILSFSIVGLTTTVFIQFTPQGFNALSLRVPIYFEDENGVIVERIPTVEYPVLHPRVHIVTLSYLTRYLMEETPHIIGDRVLCTGFMYVGRRDLYTSCVSIHEVLRVHIESGRIVKHEFKALGNINAIMVINYPVVLITEEPIEYRSNILRRAVILKANLIYNSGITVATVVG
jgi:hypothetical protein